MSTYEHVHAAGPGAAVMSLSIRPQCACVYITGPPVPGSVVPPGDGVISVRLYGLALLKQRKREKEIECYLYGGCTVNIV